MAYPSVRACGPSPAHLHALSRFAHTLATGFEVIEGKKTADSVIISHKILLLVSRTLCESIADTPTRVWHGASSEYGKLACCSWYFQAFVIGESLRGIFHMKLEDSRAGGRRVIVAVDGVVIRSKIAPGLSMIVSYFLLLTNLVALPPQHLAASFLSHFGVAKLIDVSGQAWYSSLYRE
ncbi:uncharacterized protein EI90DRAFT_3085820 [Cantharellus anzutake]|uniref:uncharacterized protein n=1 Tax=Cantharellus anzutake TaxID=1750568 RepID=UPI001905D433|nr:uncharacterized protein EI90DRAFT_3085820 [Cantharellus anzutake]KAF8316964.1 hypothetical protein EI90DRAFT_3085820 [Cantharellus anzutake]